MGGNIPGGDFLGGNFPRGRGGGGGIFLEPGFPFISIWLSENT